VNFSYDCGADLNLKTGKIKVPAMHLFLLIMTGMHPQAKEVETQPSVRSSVL
jgi:hypothetical protein